MTERRKLIVGNWKMNGLRRDGAALAADLGYRMADPGGDPGCELLVCPPATLLGTVSAALANSGIGLGGQDCHTAARGPHTGDVSAEMLADWGCTHVILGHSERRHGHGESDAEVRAKIAAARRAGLTAILCVGETRQQRDAGDAVDAVLAQLAGSLPPDAAPDPLVVAYEPVWAIGTGLGATSKDIARMHAAIRDRLPRRVRILYGGSVNPQNAAVILALPEVGGALVGGASLSADDFWAIARCCA